MSDNMRQRPSSRGAARGSSHRPRGLARIKKASAEPISPARAADEGLALASGARVQAGNLSRARRPERLDRPAR
jgi:hypothetical protein